MSKSSREGLFGITLTELVIILFFIMLLLAIFNIEKVNEELEETKELIQFTPEEVIPKEVIITTLFPDGPIPSDLYSSEQIEDILKELKKAQEDLTKLTQETNGVDGDCREGGFWITSKCADHCWEVSSDSTSRAYDYLLDIGVCNASVVVQRSVWKEKTEQDFLLVDGAYELAEMGIMSPSELFRFLEIIRETGFLQEPKQCYHSVRLINLDDVSATRWESIELQVGENVGRLPLTKPSTQSFKDVRALFPPDICETIIENQASPDAVPKIASGQNNRSTNITNQEKPSKPKVNIIPAKLVQSTYNENLLSDRRCNRINSLEFDARIKVQVDSRGDPVEVEVLDDEGSFSRSERKILDIAKDALMKSSFIAGTVEGITVNSDITMMYNFPQNVCRSRY